ncbi:MAG: alpha/beta hydrolase [Mycobacteriaceae bacterium]|nr:alpha/beta hydrolase [Mycobacteriaceae bacterium]
MESRRIPTPAGVCTLRVDGPHTQHAVLMLPGRSDTAADFDEVCVRLHNSGLRTAVVESHAGMDEKAVRAVLDDLGLPMVNLFGHGAGAELAWQTAARAYDRFISLVVIGRGHPALPDPRGDIKEPDCPAVEVATTVLVGSNAPERRWAELSGRYVYGDYRVVPLPKTGDILRESPREVATEIVLRTSIW